MARNGTITSFHQFLACPLCFEIFTNATLLNCGHTFCLKCLHEYDKSCVTWSRMVCPLCRETTTFQEKRVDGLPPNITVNSLVGHLKLTTGTSKATSAEVCLSCTSCDDNLIAVTFCIDCDVNMCEACYQGHLQMKRLFAKHHVVSIQDILNENMIIADQTNMQSSTTKHESNDFTQHGRDNYSASSDNTGNRQVRLPAVELQVPGLNRVLSIAKEIDLPGWAIGMAPVSDESVVIGYGRFKPGADLFTLSGSKTQHLSEEVGKVYDIVFLSDGKSVVSQTGGSVKVYDSDGSPTDMQFKRNSNIDGYYSRLCRDELDNIYAVNKANEINVYNVGNEKPQRVLPTGHIRPRQVAVTKAGVIITSSCDLVPSTVTVFDAEGRVGGSIKSTGHPECLYATVDSEDRVFIARVTPRMLKLSVYTLEGLEGTRLEERMQFAELNLSGVIPSWCYMFCLSPNVLAFASTKLYFIRIPNL